METDLFDWFRKGEDAQVKFDRLSMVQRKLVSMKFILAMFSDIENVKVERHEDQELNDGRRISILVFELKLGTFVFGIPQYTDSALVLIDFELIEDELLMEGWSATPLH